MEDTRTIKSIISGTKHNNNPTYLSIQERERSETNYNEMEE